MPPLRYWWFWDSIFVVLAYAAIMAAIEDQASWYSALLIVPGCMCLIVDSALRLYYDRREPQRPVGLCRWLLFLFGVVGISSGYLFF